MWRNLMTVSALILAPAFLAGCAGDVADTILGSGDDLEAAMADVELETDRMIGEMLAAELDAAGGGTDDDGGVTVEKSFTLTRSCPAGGELNVEGQLVKTFDPDAGVMQATFEGSRTRTDCAFFHEDVTITVNGASNWETFRRRVNGLPDGPQTAHYAGSWTAESSTGQVKSCSFDYTIVRYPETQTKTIEGTICGKSVSGSITWSLED